MKVVAYSIKSFEKEPLAIANRKKHDITLISNVLSVDSVSYAEGKEAVIVFEEDDLSAAVINSLADLGVKYIATRSTSAAHIDQDAAALRAIRIASVPLTALIGLNHTDMPMALAEETILNLDKWQNKRCLGNACVCSRACDQVKQTSSKNHNVQTHEP